MYTIVSLFSGAGGLDLGFSRHGFETLWANDFIGDACQTFKHWSPDTQVVSGDIKHVDFRAIPDSDIILGGFPCQGFSAAGPRKLDDSRNVLYRYFVRLVAMKQPKMFVAENVRGLLSMGNGNVIAAIIHDFADRGYDVRYHLVNAADYGVPQDRRRIIIVGVRNDLTDNMSFTMPTPAQKHKTLLDALGNLSEFDEDDVCMTAFSSRYMSRNRKRSWDQVSFTIPAMAKQVPLHPSSPDMINIGRDLWRFGDNGITRRLSYREAAAIQTFPENMVFYGDLTSKYRQIGNAVPVVLAEHVAMNIKTALESV